MEPMGTTGTTAAMCWLCKLTPRRLTDGGMMEEAEGNPNLPYNLGEIWGPQELEQAFGGSLLYNVPPNPTLILEASI